MYRIAEKIHMIQGEFENMKEKQKNSYLQNLCFGTYKRGRDLFRKEINEIYCCNI